MTVTLLDSALSAPAFSPVAPRERAVLSISGMPRHLRLRVEELMAEHLSPAELSEYAGEFAGPDSADLDDDAIWDTRWFTRWRRDPGRTGINGAGSSVPTVSCREVIDAPANELAIFRAALNELASTFRFSARV